MDFDTLVAKISERFEGLESRKKDLGTAFEKAAKFYLSSEKSLIPFKNVWMWKDNGNPLNPEGKPDMGIDLVAEDEKGNIWTIQVKEHIDSGEDVSKKEIDSFFAASESYSIPENRRLLMLFGCDLGKNSRKERGYRREPQSSAQEGCKGRGF